MVDIITAEVISTVPSKTSDNLLINNILIWNQSIESKKPVSLN